MNKLFYILFFFLPIFGFSQTDTIAHMYTFGGLNNDNAEAVDATADGGYIVVGSTSSNSSGNTDIYLLKVDSLCNYEWSFAIGGTNNDWGYSVKQTFDKGYIIAASSNSDGNGGYNAVLYKRDSLGNYQWTKSYGGQDWDFAYDVVQTYDSGFVFCGETYNNTNGFSDVYVVKTTNLGDTLWTKTIGGALVDKGNAIIETSDSNIVIAGIKNTVADSTQAYLIKLTPNGTLLWDSVYGGVGYEEINGMIEVNDGGFVLAGAIIVSDLDFWVLKTDKDGLVIWNNVFGNSGDEKAYDIFELTNSDLYIVGHTMSNGAGGKDAILFALNTGGFWAGMGPTYGSSGDEALKSITLGVKGGYCMSGYTNSYGNGNEDLMLIRFDSLRLGQNGTLTNYFDIIPLKINEVDKQANLSLYPNPSNGHLNINIQGYSFNEKYSIGIYAIDGTMVAKFNINKPKIMIDISNLSKQFYIYRIQKSETLIGKGKLIIY